MSETGTAKKFLRNIVSNVGGYVVNVLVALFLSPFVVHTLGDESYGLWVLVISLTGYYGLLDLGVRSAVGQYVTRYFARDEIDGVNRTLNTALVLLSGVAAIALVATAVLAWLLPRWVHVADPAAAARAQWAMAIAGFGIAVSIPTAVFQTVTYARERFDIMNGIAISHQLVYAGTIVAVLKSGHGLLGIACVVTGLGLLARAAEMIVAFRLMPGLRLSVRLASRASVKEIYSYGVFSFIINAADRIVRHYTDAVIVGAVFSAVAVTYFAIGGNLVVYYQTLVLTVAWTITPHATALDARGDRAALRSLLLNGARGLTFLSAVIGAGLVLTGRDFLTLWMGPKYVAGEGYVSSYEILVILTVATFLRTTQGATLQILFGMRKVKFLAGLSCAEALLNLTLSLVLARFFGIAGVAWGTLIPLALSQLLVQGPYCVRLLEADGRAYALGIARAAVPVVAAMWLSSELVGRAFAADTWLTFVAKVALVALPAPFIGLFVVLNRDERARILTRLGLRRAAAA